MADTRDTQGPFKSDARLVEPPGPPTQPAQNDLDLFSPLLTHAQAWTQQVTHLNTSIQCEWLNFVDKRLKEEAAFGQSLVTCKAPDDIMRVYTSFYRTAVEDYQKELTTLAQLGASVSIKALGAAKSDSALIDPSLSAARGTPAPHASARRRDAVLPAESH